MRPDLDRANDARRAAHRKRTHWLEQVRAGNITVPELVDAACLPEHHELLRITLWHLFEAQYSRHHATNAVSALRKLTGAPPGRSLTVAWLVDARAGGVRLRALGEVLQPVRMLPWPGFPYAQKPN